MCLLVADGGCGEEHNCGDRSDKADTDDATVVVGDNARGDDAPNARYKDNSTHDANALQGGVHTVCIVLRYRESGLYLMRLGWSAAPPNSFLRHAS